MKPSYYLVIGGVVLGGTAIAVTTAWALGLGTPRVGVIYETYVPDTARIAPGAPVLYRGVRFGTVTAVDLATIAYGAGEDSPVVVRFGLHPDGLDDERVAGFVAGLGDRLFVRLAVPLVTGTPYLELVLAEPGAEPVRSWRPEHPVIPWRPTALDELGATAQDTLQKINSVDFEGVVARLDATLLKMQPSLERLPATLDAITGAITAVDVKVLSEEVRSTLASARTSITRLRDAAMRLIDDSRRVVRRGDEVVTAIDPEHIHKFIEDLASAGEKLPNAVTKLDGTLTSANSAASGVHDVARVIDRDLGTILADLRQVARDLASLSSTLERYPSLLLFGNAPAGRRAPR